MRIPRVNIYLPEQLAAQVRPLGLNLSALLQTALRDQLEAAAAGGWLDRLAALPKSGVDHRRALRALDQSRGS